jgi:hypothetical protein
VTMTLMFSSALLQHAGERCERVIGRAVAGACTNSESDPQITHVGEQVLRLKDGAGAVG